MTNWFKQAQTYFGYKIVGVNASTKQPYSIYSKEPINIVLGKQENYPGIGLFLGTSKQFCLDYYAFGTQDEDGELLLTYQFSPQNIIKGEPSHPNGEIQVNSATLVKIEEVDKENMSLKNT